MLPSQQEKLLDCVSAKELLDALNTLNNITEESATPDFQLSFSHTSHSLFEAPSQLNNMDFQMYINKKNNQTKHTPIKKKNNDKARPINHSQTPKKKTQEQLRTPIKKSQIDEFKSRSHSPLLHSHSPQPRLSQLAQPKKPSQNKENQSDYQTRKDSSKVSYQSRKILEERQKKGKSYVPIQLRTNEFLKKKQQKINKIQEITNANKVVQEKQCTFKPVIQKWKKPKNMPEMTKNRHKNCSQAFNDQSETTYSQIETHLALEVKEKSIEKKVQEVTIRKPKPKNEKFNMLLDLIN